MHKNARLTPKGRALMLARLEAGQHQRDVAQAMGVSLTTLKKWLRRYRTQGPVGLLDRTCRPRCSPRRVPAERVAEVIALRRQRRTGRFICQHLGISAASVSRILRRAHLSRWRDLEPCSPVRRYQREHPGELLHLDIKKLGRIKVSDTVLPAGAVAKPVTAASAGTSCTWQSMTPRGPVWPMSLRMSAATPPAAS